MKRFLLRLAVFGLLTISTSGSIWVLLLQHNKWDNIGVLNYQVKKLKKNKGKHFRKVIIGDSSGGNAISTSHDPTMISLCLSGSYGFEGLIPFIDLVNEYITYDTVLVINTIDISTRQVSSDAMWLPDIHSSDMIRKLKALYHARTFSKPLLKGVLLRQNLYTETPVDYPYSGGKTSAFVNKGFNHSINSDKLNQLKLLDEKLKHNGKEYMMAFGPSLPYDTVFFEHLINTISESGIRHLLNKPFLLDENSKGDSEDHVHPDYRHLSTEYYDRLYWPVRN